MVLARVVLMLVPLVLSLTFHEFAHAFVATRFGDDTARRQGRLTLNPLVHIDPIGTLLIPAMMALSGGLPFFGWARPVPVDPTRFRAGVNRRRAFAIVSAAGPLSNLLLAIIAVGIYAFGGQLVRQNGNIATLLEAMLTMNVALFVFNLLPIPPLDGSKLLPRAMDGLQRRVAPYGIFALMLLMMVPQVQHVLIGLPMHYVKQGILNLFAPALQ